MAKRPVQPTAQAIEHFRHTYIMLVKQTGLCLGKNFNNQPFIKQATPGDIASLGALPYVDVSDQARKNRT